MPNRTRIAELDLKIENLLAAIEALRRGNTDRSEMDRMLSDLARVKAERLRLMLRQININTERGLHDAIVMGGLKEREA